MNADIRETKKISLTKITKYLFYSSIFFGLIVIPLMILSFLDIGGTSLFVAFIVFLSIFCVVVFALIIIDIVRIYGNKKQRS